MPTYVRLIRMTDEGRKSLKGGKSMYEEARRIFEASGGKVLHSYATLGSYDFVAVVEAPDDATAMKISAQVGAMGLQAETLPAVPTEEFVRSLG